MKKNLIILFTLSILRGGLIQPINNAAVFRTHVLFEWEQIPSADQYQFMVATNPDFSDIVINETNETLIYIAEEGLNWNTQYYWRIRKNNVNGTIGSWLDAFTFTIGDQRSNVNTTINDDSQIEEGLTIFGSFFNYFSAVIDKDGNEIWNSGNEDLVFYNTNEDGDLFGCYLDNSSDNNLPGVEFNINNEFIWEEPNDEFLHHDIIQLPNGNYMGVVAVTQFGPIPIGSWTPLFQGLGYVADGVTPEFTWVGDKIVEWDKDTKEVVWSWNTFDHYDTQDYDFQGGTWDQAFVDQQYDWTHINAITYDNETSSIYVSVRHLSRITRIDYPSGDIIWNMGREYSSDDVDFGHDLGFSFQHSVQITDDGNIVTFDNGNLSEIFLGTDDPTSRAMEIDISYDGSEYSADVAWEYDLPTNLFGFASGNTQKLDNGNYLVTTVGGGGTTLEVNANGEIVWEADLNLTLPNGAVYRAIRIPSVYPVAFSVITEDLHLHGSEPSVYIEDSTVVFSIHNEGSLPVSYQYSLSDEQGWFDTDEYSTTIQSGESQSITFSSSNIMNLAVANPITFTVTPSGREQMTKSIMVNGYTFPVSIENEIIPVKFELGDPYPNPFNPFTTIRLTVDARHTSLLRIYDISGRMVETLINEQIEPGQHEVHWNATGHPSGLYFITLTSGKFSQTKKILLLK